MISASVHQEAGGTHGLNDIVVEILGDCVGGERQKPGVDPLCEGHDVGNHVEFLDTESCAEPPEAGDDFVGDEGNAVPVEDLSDSGEIAGRRNRGARRYRHRFGYERSDTRGARALIAVSSSSMSRATKASVFSPVRPKSSISGWLRVRKSPPPMP